MKPNNQYKAQFSNGQFTVANSVRHLYPPALNMSYLSFVGLSPVASCCSPPSIALVVITKITEAGSVTEGATIGVKVILLLVLSVLIWRMSKKMTVTLNDKTNNLSEENLEVLEQLLSRHSSLFSITEEFYREMAAKSGRPLEQVKAESAYNTANLFLIFSKFREIITATEQTKEAKIQGYFQFYKNLKELIVPYLSLIYPTTRNDLERFLLRTQLSIAAYPSIDLPLRIGIFLCSLVSEKYKEALRLEQFSRRLSHQTKELIKQCQQANLNNYPWREISFKELNQQAKILFNKFLDTLSEEKKQEIVEQYKKHYLDYLEEIEQVDNTPASKNVELEWGEQESTIKEQKSNNQLLKEEVKEKIFSEEDKKVQEIAEQYIIKDRLTQEEEEKLKNLYLQYLSEEEYNYQTKQEKLFEEELPSLIKKYPGRYVLFENGKVIDQDFNEDALLDRIEENSVLESKGFNAVYVRKVPQYNK